MSIQLPLNIQLHDTATFANFYNAGNEPVVSHLLDLLQAKTHSVIYLWGQPGTGRSHLLQACCHHAQQLQLSATYLPLADHQQWQPDVLENLEQYDLVCLDDIDKIAGNTAWEEACFNLYNRVQAAQGQLIITGEQVPQQLRIKLADLVSRLAWGLVLRLQPLADAEKIKALQLRAKNRGLTLTEDVARFLLQRCPRDMQALFITLEKLDHASLAAQRRLTIPFIKQVLAI